MASPPDRDGTRRVAARVARTCAQTGGTGGTCSSHRSAAGGPLRDSGADRPCDYRRRPIMTSRIEKFVSGSRIDHLGIAVESIAQARGFYEALGLHVTHEETVEHEGVRVAMLPLGESRIELLEPLGPETTVGRFLTKRGAGLHHVALHVDDIAAAWAELQARGFAIVSSAGQTGAGGHLYFFVQPKSSGGGLLGIC